MCSQLDSSKNLLGIDPATSDRFEQALLDKQEYLRPGFSRLSLPYFMSEREVKYVLGAVLHVAEEGWRVLPQYKFNYKTGEWKHRSRFTKFPERKWLGHLSLEVLSQQQQQMVSSSGRDERRVWTQYYGKAKTKTATDPNASIRMEFEGTTSRDADGANDDDDDDDGTAASSALSAEEVFDWCEGEARRITAKAELAKHLLPVVTRDHKKNMLSFILPCATNITGPR